jgi:transposase
MSTPTEIFSGVNVSKDHLDLALSQGAKSWQFTNSAKGVSALADLIKEHQPELVVLEATGGYEQLAGMVARRRQIHRMLTAERNRLRNAHPSLHEQIFNHLD